MSKWFEVEVQTLIVCAVEVRDDENEIDAMHTAQWNCFHGGRQTATALPLPAEHLATIKKNADKVLFIDDEEGDGDL